MLITTKGFLEAYQQMSSFSLSEKRMCTIYVRSGVWKKGGNIKIRERLHVLEMVNFKVESLINFL